MGLWFKRKRQNNRVPERVRDVDVLVEASRKLVSATRTEEMGTILVRACEQAVGCDCVMVFTLDDEREHAIAIATGRHGISIADPFAISLATDRSAVSRVIRERTAHRVLDGDRESLQQRDLATLLEFASAVYVPLRLGADVIGVAVVGSTAARAFRKDEVELLQKLADDAAAAMERARFAQQMKEVGERDLIVAQIAREIREALEPEQVMEVAAREIAEQTDADRVELFAAHDDRSPDIVVRWAEGAIEHDVVDGGRHVRSSLARAAADHLQTQIGSDNRGAAGRVIAIPLVQRGQRVGVAEIERNDEPFAAHEVRLLELIGVEVAAAIEYGRLYQGSRVHLDQQLALARAAQALTADLRFERVLERIVSEVVKVLPTASAAFYVYDRDDLTLTLSAAFGEAEQQAVGERMELVGLAGRVAQTGVSQLTNAYRQDLGDHIHPVFQDVTRALAVPVRWQGDLRGVISVASRAGGRPFTDSDVNLLEAFADLASLALHNAEAYSANSRQARIQAGFYRISQMFSSSLSRTETLAALAHAATEALDGNSSVVVGGDLNDNVLHVEAHYETPERLLAALSSPDVLAEGPWQVTIGRKKIATSRDVSLDERLGERWRDALVSDQVASQLAVPITAGDQPPAAVVVFFHRPVRFGDEELVVANNLASAAGAALERAELFERERRTRRLAEVLADVSALLAETLKTQTVLELIVQQAAVLLGADVCNLALVSDRHWQPHDHGETQLAIHSTAGIDSELVAALRGADVGTLVEDVARSKRSQSVSELASKTSGQVLDDVAYNAYLGVPIIHTRGHLIGVLSVYMRAHRVWDDAEIAALASFANSAAIAIRNAELYDNVRRERDTIEKLLASIGEGIVATDASGVVTIWNDAAAQITGVPPQHAVGRSWRDVLVVAGHVVLDAGQSVIEARPGGASLWLSVTASRLRDDAATQRGGWIYAFRDISATYALDRLKTDFVSTVSYALRAPLTSIYGFAHTILRDDLDFDEADRQVFLEYIASETERLTRIVDDLLQAAKLDAGTVAITLGQCDVYELVSDVARAARSHSDKHNIDCIAQPGIFARADTEKLREAVTNMVDNAIRFSPDGGDIRIDAEQDGAAVRIAITDNGVGIAPSEQKNLFTKFYVSPSGREQGGSGLGLYISKQLVEAMGGTVGVSSHVGAGSTFLIELPAITVESEAIA